MKEFIEKLIGRLETEKAREIFDYNYKTAEGISKSMEIVNQLAEEYGKDTNVGSNDGWIPFDEAHFPPITGVYLVSYGERQPICIEEFNGKWFSEIHTYKQPYAWQPLPAPYQPKGD